MNSPLYTIEVERKEGESLMYVNYLGAPFVPSIADFPEVMARTVDALVENANVSRIIFVQQKNYNYPFSQVELLVEIAQLYNFFMKQDRILSPEKLFMMANVSFAYLDIIYFIML